MNQLGDRQKCVKWSKYTGATLELKVLCQSRLAFKAFLRVSGEEPLTAKTAMGIHARETFLKSASPSSQLMVVKGCILII